MKISQIDIDHLNIIRNEIEVFLSDIDYKKYVLEIAPSKDRLELEIDTLNIIDEDNPTYIADLCSADPVILPKKYDTVICTEVLEHVDNPFLAVERLHSFLRKGGVAYVTTPFNFRKHGPLPDNWRFTDMGLKLLFNHFSTVIVTEIPSDRFLAPIGYKTLAIK